MKPSIKFIQLFGSLMNVARRVTMKLTLVASSFLPLCLCPVTQSKSRHYPLLVGFESSKFAKCDESQREIPLSAPIKTCCLHSLCEWYHRSVFITARLILCTNNRRRNSLLFSGLIYNWTMRVEEKNKKFSVSRRVEEEKTFLTSILGGIVRSRLTLVYRLTSAKAA